MWPPTTYVSPPAAGGLSGSGSSTRAPPSDRNQVAERRWLRPVSDLKSRRLPVGGVPGDRLRVTLVQVGQSDGDVALRRGEAECGHGILSVGVVAAAAPQGCEETDRGEHWPEV